MPVPQPEMVEPVEPVAEPTVEAPVETPYEEQAPAAVYPEETADSAIPLYTPDMPLPASALDGYVLDEQEVLDAIVQVDTQSVEQEAQVLEAVEVMHASQATDDELLEDSSAPPTPVPMPSLSAPPRPATPPSPPGSNSTVKHGFF
jgi:hypothetical protein